MPSAFNVPLWLRKIWVQFLSCFVLSLNWVFLDIPWIFSTLPLSRLTFPLRKNNTSSTNTRWQVQLNLWTGLLLRFPKLPRHGFFTHFCYWLCLICIILVKLYGRLGKFMKSKYIILCCTFSNGLMNFIKLDVYVYCMLFWVIFVSTRYAKGTSFVTKMQFHSTDYLYLPTRTCFIISFKLLDLMWCQKNLYNRQMFYSTYFAFTIP